MQRKIFKFPAMALAVASAVGINQHAHAQELALEEVVVTAQKREETSQDVPISIATLSESAIE